ncbi:hypothetical protein [Neolewinella persica]|uniref:hypothetical protein n=1 Tax=Neolewinella persica TaxID=70998 RepID=UPI00037C9A96|nr:hypothetical protein [Neolewinella persica]
MKPLFTLFAFAALFTFMSCGPKVYTAPNAASATAAHSVIAIIPPVVNIKGRKKDDPEALKAAAEADVYTFQQEMYSWMLRRKQQGKIRGVEIMDPETVNAKLERAGYSTSSRIFTPKELATTLGVDAVITSKFNTSKPMSEGAAVALGVLFGAWGSTNETSASLSIHDPEEGMLWNYDWVASGTFTSSEALVNGLMRNASRRMPYVIN